MKERLKKILYNLHPASKDSDARKIHEKKAEAVRRVGKRYGRALTRLSNS